MPIFQIVRLLLRALRLAFKHKGELAELANLAPAPKGIPAIMEANRRGDYQTALNLVEQLNSKGKNAEQYSYFRGVIAFQLGHLEEAEKFLRETLGVRDDSELRANTLEYLGYVLQAQGRHEEAIASYEESIEVRPESGSGHRAVSEAMLASGGDPKAALARARKAVEIDRSAESLSAESYKLNVGESLATLAWAVGVTEGGEWEIDKLGAESLGLCGRTTLPLLARVHYDLGLAYQAARVGHKSMSHFEKAVILDPHGHYGRLAQSQVAGVTE